MFFFVITELEVKERALHYKNSVHTFKRGRQNTTYQRRITINEMSF